MSSEKAKKRSFKVPNILWIIMTLILLAVILTYVIPAGKFATDADGRVLANSFSFLDQQTPVSFTKMLMLILDGMYSQGRVMILVMAMGASTQLLLGSNAIDKLFNWATYKLQDKGQVVLLLSLFILMTYIGGFAGSDALIAMVPIGVTFSRRLKLDPIVALGLTMFPAMIGFATGPSTAIFPQLYLDVAPYSGFLFRFVTMNIYMIIGFLFLLRYVRKIQLNPAASLMAGIEVKYDGKVEESGSTSHTDLDWRSILSLVLYVGQYLVIVYYSLSGGDNTFAITVAANIVSAILIGFIAQMSLDESAGHFAKGVNSMGFVVFIIGLAGVFSLVLQQGNILATIVYYLTQPLIGISKGLANIGIAAVVTILKLFIPSASSKAAVILPIVQPITEALEITGQSATQAYQLGDRWLNLIHPALGWTMGSLLTAKVPYDKWLKWITPILVFFYLFSMVILYFLTIFDWTGL